MRYRILGPLTVTVDGRSVAITAGRDRVVLAMLLLHAGRVLGVSTLADAVWGGDPPATARGQLQSCVSRLRRLLPAGVIHSDPAGYSLTPAPGELDAAEFLRLVAEARDRQDAALYRQALDLWRGDAAAGIDAHGVRLAAATLDQHHVATLEAWAELELAAGREGDLIGELSAAVDRFPLQEKLSGQLMRALHRSGRQAESLGEYRRIRSALREELGLDPGHDLQDLHTGILTGAVETRPAEPEKQSAPIRCLPRTVGDFTGRVEVVRRLVAAIDEAGVGAPVVAVVDGMAGSGKTTLALHVADLLGDRYPDAHLFVDLQGHSTEQPLEPSAVLLILLRQLGIDYELPPGLVDRISLWRTELAKRRTLVLFDNAASSAQVADLMPTAPGSLALVTSRRRLVGLDGVHPESLSVLNPDEAITLLSRIAGPRVWTEPEAAAEVVRRCGGLPLAIRLAGARLAHRPRWQVSDLVRRLGDSALPELAAEERSVASAFAVSYRHLPESVRTMFRLLGLCPANEFDALSAAALSGRPLEDARDALDDLVDVHLIDEPEAGVYRMHDLLREYAAMLAAEISAGERAGALHAVLDLQFHAAAQSNLPAYREAVMRDTGARTPLRPDLVAAVADPAARLERERPYLAAYVDSAAALPELRAYTWQLPRAAWRQLFMRGYLDDIFDLNRRALAVLEPGGDRAATATALNYLASVHYRRTQFDEAARLLERSIALRRQLPNRDALARTMSNLAALLHEMGHWGRSIEVALEVRQIAGAQFGRDEVNVMAHSYFRLGRYREALRCHRLRLMAQLEIRDPTRLGDTLLNIAVIKHRLGMISLDTAIRQVRTALSPVRRANYRHGECNGLHELALLLATAGRFGEAIAAHLRAIEIAEDLVSLDHEAKFFHGFGTTLALVGDETAAQAMFERALRAAEKSRSRFAIAVSQAGLGGCLVAVEPGAARRLLEQARTTLATLGAPELLGVEQSLAALGGVDHLRAGSVGETMVR